MRICEVHKHFSLYTFSWIRNINIKFCAWLAFQLWITKQIMTSSTGLILYCVWIINRTDIWFRMIFQKLWYFGILTFNCFSFHIDYFLSFQICKYVNFCLTCLVCIIINPIAILAFISFNIKILSIIAWITVSKIAIVTFLSTRLNYSIRIIIYCFNNILFILRYRNFRCS